MDDEKGVWAEVGWRSNLPPSACFPKLINYAFHAHADFDQ